jgi:predicted nucleotidyltransferase
MRTDKPLAATLLGTSRSAILATLLLRPERELHARELSRVSGVSIGTLQRELGVLVDLGLLTRRAAGRQVFYAADRTSPVFEELAGLLRKTAGLADVLREALAPLTSAIRMSFVYGSMAAGKAGPHSDIDLMVVGEASLTAVAKAVHPAQARLGREINPTVMSEREWTRRRREGDGFVRSLLTEPKIWLSGDDDDASKPGKGRTTARA